MPDERPVPPVPVWPEAMIKDVACQVGALHVHPLDPIDEIDARDILDRVDRIARAHGVTLGAMPVLPSWRGSASWYTWAKANYDGPAVMSGGDAMNCYRRWLRDVHGYTLAEDAP